MHGLVVLLFLIKHRGKVLLKRRKEREKHLLILLPLTVVTFFLRRLEEASLCARAHINIQTVQVPNNSDRTAEATLQSSCGFH